MIGLIGIVIGIELSNTKGDLNFEGDDKAIDSWLKSTYGDIKTSDIIWNNERGMWEYSLFNSTDYKFFTIRFSGSIDDTQEELNKKVDMWTSKWLEILYNDVHLQTESINMTGRDYLK